MDVRKYLKETALGGRRVDDGWAVYVSDFALVIIAATLAALVLIVGLS
jgi:hypothetical protein